jgi:small-conductance mechanosensitive channel
MDFNGLADSFLNWLTTSGIKIILKIALIAIAAAVALRLIRLLSNRLMVFFSKDQLEIEMEKRAKTLSSFIRYALSVATLVVAAMMIFAQLGVEIGPVLAAAGIVGLAVGFGAQQLVQDVISGFFILMEDQIRVGDVVQIGGQGGLVERVSLRMTTLRDLAGNVHFVRNGQINIVTNMTKNYSYYVFDIGVAYRENVDEVIELIKEVGEELRKNPDYKDDILEPIEVLGLDKFGDSAVVIKARIKTMPIKQWGVGREFNRLIKKKFDEKNIEIPFPHVTMYIGEDKQGRSAPLHVSLKAAAAGRVGQPSAE